MPGVLVPGVAQVVMQGTVVGNPWAVVWHFRFGTSTAPWSAADLTTLCNTILASFKTRLQTHFDSSTVWSQVTGVDIGTSTPAAGVSTGATWTGTGSANLTPATCVLVNLHIASRYRGGHPRSYFGIPASADSTDRESWTSTAQTAWANGVVGVINDCVTALPGSGSGAVNHCVPRYTYAYTDDPTHHKYLKTKSGLVGVFTVQSYAVHPKIATQRRRLQTG